MENKTKEYLSIALIVVVSVGAFYFGKFIVTSVFDYFYQRNQPASAFSQIKMTNAEFDEGRRYMKSNPQEKSKYIEACKEGHYEEVKRRGISNPFSDYQITEYCDCTLNKITAGSTFDNAVISCASEKLIK